MRIESLASGLTSGGLGLPAAAGVAFIGGVVAGFGPCVLPMLPALFGYVTGRVGEDGTYESASPLRGLWLALSFVLGMSLVFAAMGAAAGLVGHALMIGGWGYYLAAVVCIVIGLQMLGAINLPVGRLNRLVPTARPQRRGLLGAAMFGMVFGLVASPCSTPILAAIATLAAMSGDVVKGAGLLFLYGLGKGLPLLIIGLASGSLVFMRSASKYVPALTKVGGATLLGAAAYLIWIA